MVRLSLRSACFTLLVGSVALAQQPESSGGQGSSAAAVKRPATPSAPTDGVETKASAGTTTTTTGRTATGAVPEDPEGIRGVSPFVQAVTRGDAAFLARDYALAASEYAAAIKLEPKNPVGHLRDAQLRLQRADYEQAAEALAAAERFSEDKPTLRAQALFLRAMLREREKALTAAERAWRVLGEQTASPVLGEQNEESAARETAADSDSAESVPAHTPSERVTVIAKRQKMLEDYAQVKQRIADRVEEAEQGTKPQK